MGVVMSKSFVKGFKLWLLALIGIGVLGICAYKYHKPRRSIKSLLKKMNHYQKYDFVGFRKLIDSADKVMIRDGGFDCCGSVEKNPIVATITDRDAILHFNSLIGFSETQLMMGCACCGGPGIDWYQGDTCIVLSAVQHGTAIRWKGFPADADFSSSASIKIAQWLADHNSPGTKTELESKK
jgi:hypothetical protein